MASKETKQDQLSILFPEGKEVTIRENVYCIKPFKLGELPKVLKAINPIVGVFAGLAQKNANMLEVVTGILSEGGDNILQLMAIATKQPQEFIDELDLDEGIEVLTAVIEVNSDFFFKKALPKMTEMIQKLNGQIQ